MAKIQKATNAAAQFSVPAIRTGLKVQGVVIKKVDAGVLVDCAGGVFTGIILSKEVKDLERNGYDLSIGKELEAEIMDTDTRSDEWYFIISIAKLIQYDVWKNISAKFKEDDIITVIPTEANLGWLLVDMHGIKGFIPLSQLAPVHYPRVEDGDQEKIFEKLLNLVGKEFRVRIINLDEDNKRIVLSEREALKEEREKILGGMKVGNEYDGTVSGISSYWVFVTIGGGIEGLVHISELTYGHVANVDRLAKVGQVMHVRIIGFEDGKISLSAKQLKDDPRSIIPQKFKIGDVIEGEVVRFVPYWVFVRIYDDINGLIHLSELSERNVANPAELVRLGQVVKAKLIALDPSQRKIGLSVKALTAPAWAASVAATTPRPAAKKVKSLDDVDTSTEGEAKADIVMEKSAAKAPKKAAAKVVETEETAAE
jgi:small subunit ribosomal protein S1